MDVTKTLTVEKATKCMFFIVYTHKTQKTYQPTFFLLCSFLLFFFISCFLIFKTQREVATDALFIRLRMEKIYFTYCLKKELELPFGSNTLAGHN